MHSNFPSNFPLFEDTINPVLEGKEMIARNNILAIVKHWENDEFLTFNWNWPHHGARTFIYGGVENGEEPSDAAVRKILKATGFVDLDFVAEICQFEEKYYAEHKGTNRHSCTTVLYFELKSGKQQEPKSEENLHHSFQWIEKTKINHHLNVKSNLFAWHQLNIIMKLFKKFEKVGVQK